MNRLAKNDLRNSVALGLSANDIRVLLVMSFPEHIVLQHPLHAHIWFNWMLVY